MFYGPFAENLERRIDFVTIGELKPGKDYGRAGHRKKMADQNAKE